MQVNEKDLRRYLAQRPCTACHYQQEPELLVVLVHRKHSCMVMTGCSHCHHRGIVVVSFPKRTASLPSTHVINPITIADVRDMRHFLTTFNGDFRALFGQGHSGNFATE